MVASDRRDKPDHLFSKLDALEAGNLANIRAIEITRPRTAVEDPDDAASTSPSLSCC